LARCVYNSIGAGPEWDIGFEIRIGCGGYWGPKTPLR